MQLMQTEEKENWEGKKENYQQNNAMKFSRVQTCIWSSEKKWPMKRQAGWRKYSLLWNFKWGYIWYTKRFEEGEKIWRAKGIALSSVFSSVTRKDGGHWSSLYSSEGNLFLI